jgi:indole-3-glycerol phosphate synthase
MKGDSVFVNKSTGCQCAVLVEAYVPASLWLRNCAGVRAASCVSTLRRQACPRTVSRRRPFTIKQALEVTAAGDSEADHVPPTCHPMSARSTTTPAEPTWRPAGILREAVDIKRIEMKLAEEMLLERPDHPVNMRLSFYEARPGSRFTSAIRRSDGTLAVVAALKRFQPRYNEQIPERIADLDNIGREARILELAGVDAAFLNTDAMRYGCEVGEITKIAREVAKTSTDRGLPISRHDLIIHPIQIAEAAVAGAAAVTIVASACLTDLLDLLNAATAMGVEAIVECHSEIECELAIQCGATIMFFSNRDRTTNLIHLGTAERLRRDIPAWILTLGGGGISTAREAWSLLDAGFDAIVLGEALLKSRRGEDLVREIRTQQRPVAPFGIDIEGDSQ